MLYIKGQFLLNPPSWKG